MGPGYFFSPAELRCIGSYRLRDSSEAKEDDTAWSYADLWLLVTLFEGLNQMFINIAEVIWFDVATCNVWTSSFRPGPVTSRPC